MLTFSHIVSGVLFYLGHPPESVLSRGHICETGLDKITFHLTELNLTDENWLLMRQDLPVDANESEYSLGSFTAFGRPVLIETKDESDPYHVRREIPIIGLQERKLLYDGPNAEASYVNTYPHTARSMSLYIRDGEKKIAVDPAPGASATYTVYYEPDRLVPQTLLDSAFPLEQFGGLLKAAIAKPLLAHCGYEDAKHNRLMEAIDGDLAEYRPQFEKYIKQDYQPKTSMARGFMDDDFEAYYF